MQYLYQLLPHCMIPIFSYNHIFFWFMNYGEFENEQANDSNAAKSLSARQETRLQQSSKIWVSHFLFKILLSVKEVAMLLLMKLSFYNNVIFHLFFYGSYFLSEVWDLSFDYIPKSLVMVWWHDFPTLCIVIIQVVLVESFIMFQ